MRKKIISIIPILSLILGLCTSFIQVSAAENEKYQSYTDDSAKYEYIVQNGEADIRKIYPKSDTVEIPDTIDGYPVTRIGIDGFGNGGGVFNIDDTKQVKKIVIPSGVVHLGFNAFAELKNLTEVTLPDTLENIDGNCFLQCSKLKKIDIPDSVKSIGEDCFFECSALEEVKLPDGITELKEGIFHKCDSLKSITIPESVTSIGNAFSHCTSLSEVIWNSDNVKSISHAAFLNTEWFINYSGEYILNDNGKNLYKYMGNSEEFRIPDGVESVQLGAFAQETKSTVGKKDTLKKIILPDSFTEISEGMFNGMEKLEEVVCEGNISIIRRNAFGGCGFTEFTVPDGVKYINDGAFSGCENLKTIHLPDGLEHIGDGCFKGCTSLENIILPESVTNLGKEIFRNCPNLKKLNIPVNAANSVQQHTFWVDKLEKVEFKGELTNDVYSSVPKKAWDGWELTDGDFVIVDNAVRGYNGKDKNVVIPEGITSIGPKAFLHSEIETVSFPSTLETIDKYAFYTCGLKEVTIPSRVKSVGEMAFAECSNLKKVVIEEGVRLGELAFAYCEKLDNVTVGENVRMSANAFDDTLYQKRTNPKEGDVIPETTTKPKATSTAKPTETTARPKTTSQPKSSVPPVSDNTTAPSVTPDAKPSFVVSSDNNGLNVTIDNNSVNFTDARPFIDENDRTQLPVRAVMESMNCSVYYDDMTKTVTIKGKDVDMTLKIGENTIVVDGKAANMDTAARIVNDRTYIPARFVAEALGYEVEWQN